MEVELEENQQCVFKESLTSCDGVAYLERYTLARETHVLLFPRLGVSFVITRAFQLLSDFLERGSK